MPSLHIRHAALSALSFPVMALVLLVALAAGAVGPAAAQGTELRLGQSLQLSDAPLDITADDLEVDQANGVTVFRGNVRASQGGLRLRAGQVALEYRPRADGEGQRIDRLVASGGVTLVTPGEAIEAAEATYSLSAQTLDMRGDVVFVQGENVLSGDRFAADLRAGTGRMQGRVRTIITLD